MLSISMKPIAYVHSTRSKLEDDFWDQENVYIELDTNQFTGEALRGIDSFSHVEIIFYMDQVEQNKIETTARHPRNNPNWPKIGIFAQRGKNRPNQIGTTICKIIKLEGTKLYVQGLDAVQGTPILDIKPWVEEFGPRGKTYQPSWITELMKNYWA